MAWDGEIPVQSEAGSLKVVSLRALFMFPFCISSRCSPAFPHHNSLPRVDKECFAKCSLFCFVLLKALRCLPNAYLGFKL